MPEITIKGQGQLNRRMKKISETYPEEVIMLTTQRLADEGGKKARRIAPQGVTGNLRRSIHRRRVRDGHLIVAGANYAVRVHDGGHPDPSTQEIDIRRWARIRLNIGDDDRGDAIVRTITRNQRRRGVRRPTAFFEKTLKYISKDSVFRNAVRFAVNTYNSKNKGLLRGRRV